MLELLLIVAGGLLIGGSLGLLGGGGTVLTLPLLLLLGVEPKPAIALSLVVVAATAAVAAAGHARAGHVDWRAAALFGPTTAAGGYAGGRAAEWIAGEALLLLFTALMVAAAVAMLRARPAREQAPQRHPGVLALQGALLGAVTGLVGAGGGFLFVPVFALLGGMTMQRAVGTSLAVLTLNALAALAGHLGHVAIRPELAAPLTAASVTGAWAGALLAGRAPEALLRRVFGILVLLVAAWMLARSPYVRGLLGR